MIDLQKQIDNSSSAVNLQTEGAPDERASGDLGNIEDMQRDQGAAAYIELDNAEEIETRFMLSSSKDLGQSKKRRMSFDKERSKLLERL